MKPPMRCLAIGDTAGALAAAEQARQIAADLLAGNPNSTDWQHDLSASYEQARRRAGGAGRPRCRARLLPRQPGHLRSAGAIPS